MIGERVALLFGLFIAPVILLYLGRRFRERGTLHKHGFWGGVIGYVAGMLVATVAMLAPPVWWAGGNFARDFAVHWSMLIGFVVGLTIARLLARKTREIS